MPLPVWPITLPQRPLREGYAVSAPSGHMSETEVEDGPAIRRRKVFSLWRRVQLRYRMTPAQKAAFETFWRQDLNAGVNEFTLPLWNFDGAGMVSARVRMEGASFSCGPAGPADSYVSFEVEARLA